MAPKVGMEGVTIEQVAPQQGLGEGPHWDHSTQKLYFVDIYNQKLCRLDPVTGSVTSTFVEGGPVGVAVPVEDQPNTFVAGVGTDFTLITWDGETNQTKATEKKLATVDTDRNGTRFNDGKVDSQGRFWGGTMAHEVNSVVEPNQGTFYSIGVDLVPKKEISPVTISNGLAWNSQDDTLYYIDSPTFKVVAYNFDPQSGKISNERSVFNLKENNIPGFPDGMTIDTDDNLWIAVYGGSRVIQVNPKTGKLLRTIDMPAERITSVTFGGPHLDVLYVTSASRGLSESELKAQPKAGCLFAVKGLGVRGHLANSFKMPAKS